MRKEKGEERGHMVEGREERSGWKRKGGEKGEGWLENKDGRGEKGEWLLGCSDFEK